MIIEGQFQAFQRFSSSKLVLKTVESCFAAPNYYENGSKGIREERKACTHTLSRMHKHSYISEPHQMHTLSHMHKYSFISEPHKMSLFSWGFERQQLKPCAHMHIHIRKRRHIHIYIHIHTNLHIHTHSCTSGPHRMPFIMSGRFKGKLDNVQTCTHTHTQIHIHTHITTHQGHIECPYHGWAFEGKTGECTAIPQAPEDFKPIPQVHIYVYVYVYVCMCVYIYIYYIYI
jgi:hypothetical protein